MIGFNLGFWARLAGRIAAVIGIRITAAGAERITEDGRVRIRE